MTQRVAKLIEKKRWRHKLGLESLLDVAANILALLGLVIAIGLILTVTIQGLGLSSLVLLTAFVQWLLFKCLAEHLRLQKKIAGLPFEGNISGPEEETISVCSLCGQILHSETRCDSCEATIQ